MKNFTKFLLAGIALVAAFVLSAGAFINGNKNTREEFNEKRAMLVMRQIGHTILLHSGDSNSRILPVKKLSSTTFEIEFQSKFSFIPDTLVNVVRKSLTTGSLPLHYNVSVLNCFSNELVYGFEISTQTDLVPCTGRNQPTGCYKIQLAFLEPVTTENPMSLGYIVIISLTNLIAVTLAGKILFKRKIKKAQPEITGTLIEIGKYNFYPDKRMLYINEQTIELSDKESNLLTIFASNQNLLIERDRLMKEVWENEGVFVGRSLDMFISRLRKKLKHDPGLQLVNIHGKGYKLQVNEVV
jgi:DNA-binding winged helix-turn-helix (wHTH) protein